jgi:hypothetical protein
MTIRTVPVAALIEPQFERDPHCARAHGIRLEYGVDFGFLNDFAIIAQVLGVHADIEYFFR